MFLICIPSLKLKYIAILINFEWGFGEKALLSLGPFDRVIKCVIGHLIVQFLTLRNW